MARRIAVFAFFMTIAFFAGLVVTGRMRSASESTASTTTSPAGTQPTRPAAAVAGGMPALTGVAQRAISSVTNSSSTSAIPTKPVSSRSFARRTHRSPTIPSSVSSSTIKTMRSDTVSAVRRASARGSSSRRTGTCSRTITSSIRASK